jgi:hypothetical protein
MTTFQYKVTKYDPSYYGGPGGAYTKDEWTSISDIGESFDGVVLTQDEYERVESLYLEAVRIGAEASGVERLQVVGLELYDEPGPGLVDEQWYAFDEAVEICRGLLRESGYWCRLENDDQFYVHVGYDYYMYVGANVDLRPHWAALEAAGLFIEEGYPSPYADAEP